MKRGDALSPAMQGASVSGRQQNGDFSPLAKMQLFWIFIREVSLLSLRSLIHSRLLLMTTPPFREGAKSGASAAELLALLLLLLTDDHTAQKLLLLL